jgi:hypothetical protein
MGGRDASSADDPPPARSTAKANTVWRCQRSLAKLRALESTGDSSAIVFAGRSVSPLALPNNQCGLFRVQAFL